MLTALIDRLTGFLRPDHSGDATKKVTSERDRAPLVSPITVGLLEAMGIRHALAAQWLPHLSMAAHRYRDRCEPRGQPARIGVDLVAVRGLADVGQPLDGERMPDAHGFEQADGDRADQRGAVALGRDLFRGVTNMIRAQESGQAVEEGGQHLRALHHMPMHVTHRPMRSTRPAFQTASQLSLADSVR